MISTLLPLNIESLPEFEKMASRFLMRWTKDKLMVQKVMHQEFPMLEPTDRLIDSVHETWLTHYCL